MGWVKRRYKNISTANKRPLFVYLKALIVWNIQGYLIVKVFLRFSRRDKSES